MELGVAPLFGLRALLLAGRGARLIIAHLVQVCQAPLKTAQKTDFAQLTPEKYLHKYVQTISLLLLTPPPRGGSE